MIRIQPAVRGNFAEYFSTYYSKLRGFRCSRRKYPAKDTDVSEMSANLTLREEISLRKVFRVARASTSVRDYGTQSRCISIGSHHRGGEHVGTSATLTGSLMLIHPFRQLMKARAAFNSAPRIVFNVRPRADCERTLDAYTSEISQYILRNVTLSAKFTFTWIHTLLRNYISQLLLKIPVK